MPAFYGIISYLLVPPPVPAAPPIPAPGAVPVPAFAPAPVPEPLPVPGAFGCTVMPVAGTADMLVGAEEVALGFELSVPFCELAALAAKEGAALARMMLLAATATMKVLLSISDLPPPESKRGAPACRSALINAGPFILAAGSRIAAAQHTPRLIPCRSAGTTADSNRSDR